MCFHPWWGAAAQRVAPCAVNRGTRAPWISTSRGSDADDVDECVQQEGQWRQDRFGSLEVQSAMGAESPARGRPPQRALPSPGWRGPLGQLTTAPRHFRPVGPAPIGPGPQATAT